LGAKRTSSVYEYTPSYDWPAPEVQVGDTLTLAGYLDKQRAQIARGHYEMEAWGANTIADGVSEREIVTVYDPTTTFTARMGSASRLSASI
jgi:hypothetical protein